MFNFNSPKIRFTAISRSSGARLIAALFSLSLALMLTSPVASAADDKKAPANAISKKVMPPLKAATDAYNAKDMDVALAKLTEAEAAAGKTPYDQFRIEELRALVFISQNKYTEALAIYDAHNSSPQYLEPPILETRLKLMVQLAFRTQAYDKVLEYGKQWIANHPDDTSTLDLMARSSYLKKDYQAARESVKAAIAVKEAAGEKPDEVWLQLYASCSSNLNDMPNTLAGYQKLVRYYPKTEHWAKALDLLFAVENKNDTAGLQILRLMQETGVLTQPDHFLEYAQRASDRALPGEAVKVLEEGFEKKALGGEKDKERHNRALTTARDKARADKAQLPEIEKEVRASKATTGQLEAGLGLAYYSHQMYDKAVPALESGLAKGGLKNVEDYRMALGISYLRSGQKDKAREEFTKIAATPALANVSQFWISRTYN